jgi:hypothetical protein
MDAIQQRISERLSAIERRLDVVESRQEDLKRTIRVMLWLGALVKWVSIIAAGVGIAFGLMHQAAVWFQ